jgi:hypothetical protein
MSKPFAPKVATTNHLLEGDVIYFTRPGWTRELAEAAVAETPEDADALLHEAKQYPHETVNIDLIDVDLTTGVPAPTHFRETFRTQGPSNYFHGKQAENV